MPSRAGRTLDRVVFATCTGTSTRARSLRSAITNSSTSNAKPSMRAELEERPADVGPERLQPALGVAVAAEQHGEREPVDDAPTQLPQPARPHQRRRPVVAPAADDDVPALLDGLEDGDELGRRVGEVGVGEGDGPAAGRRHTGPDGRALAPILRLPHDPIRAGGTGPVGGAVVRPVVDDDDLPAPFDVGQGGPDGGDRIRDPVALPVGGDDDRQPEVARRRRAVGPGRLLAADDEQ